MINKDALEAALEDYESLRNFINNEIFHQVGYGDYCYLIETLDNIGGLIESLSLPDESEYQDSTAQRIFTWRLLEPFEASLKVYQNALEKLLAGQGREPLQLRAEVEDGIWDSHHWPVWGRLIEPMVTHPSSHKLSMI